MTPAQVVDVVKASGLRGRGGAGFPVRAQVDVPAEGPSRPDLPVHQRRRERAGHVQQSHPDGGGSAPGARRDHPHLLRHQGAARPTSIIRYEYGTALPRPAEGDRRAVRRQSARQEHPRQGLHRSTSTCIAGPAAYICGEETGLIESLEGKRAWPRIKPPFPAVEGAFRKPTVVNNIETLACVTHIVDRGADWFKSIGVPPDPKNPRDAGSYGPEAVLHQRPRQQAGLRRAAAGHHVRELIDKYGGGVWKGRKAKGCIPGGISMGLMTEAEFDTPLDFTGPGKVGCLGLGTAAVTVFDDQTSIVDVLHNICRFFAHESCGQCTPCREGTGWMLKILDRMRRGPGPAGGSRHSRRSRRNRSASCPARRSAAWPTAPAGRSRTRSRSSGRNWKSTSAAARRRPCRWPSRGRIEYACVPQRFALRMRRKRKRRRFSPWPFASPAPAARRR